MTTDQIRETVLLALSDIAPEADLATLRPDVGLRDQLDLDSMDALNFIIAVHEQLHVDIPEADYSRLQTLDDFVGYVVEKTAV